MGGGQGGGWRYHQETAERRIAAGEDWEGPRLRRERGPSGGEKGGKGSGAESGRSRDCPWEREEGESREGEGGEGQK